MCALPDVLKAYRNKTGQKEKTISGNTGYGLIRKKERMRQS
jgi:hypothetical protein